jgi:hypothetical protein
MTDVFVSYAHADKELCRIIVGRLRELNLDVWFDTHLDAGEPFPAQLETVARNASCILVLWSKEAVRSAWVHREAAIGLEEKKLCCGSFDRALPPEPFSTVHTIDLSDPGLAWNSEPWLRLLERIGALIQRPGLPHLSKARANGESLSGKGGVFECKSIRQLRMESGTIGWSARRIASRLVSLDYAAYENLIEEDEGTISHWEAIIRHTPESFTLLMMRLPGETSMIVGSWSAFSVSRGLFQKLKAGTATSDNLNLRSIRKIEPGEAHYLFFDNISTHPELAPSTRASSRLVRSIRQVFMRWRESGIRIKEVVGHQYADVGHDLAELYGLEKQPRIKTRYGNIYWQTGEALDERLSKRWQDGL